MQVKSRLNKRLFNYDFHRHKGTKAQSFTKLDYSFIAHCIFLMS
jgi:hypothetical protein